MSGGPSGSPLRGRIGLFVSLAPVRQSVHTTTSPPPLATSQPDRLLGSGSDPSGTPCGAGRRAA